MNDIPLRTYCMAFGYDGSEYHGMQIQMRDNKKVEEIKTIEGEMESCLEELNIFYVNDNINRHKGTGKRPGGDSMEESNFLKRIRWSRVGRTDKGVHSVCQVVSFRAKIRVSEELSTLLENKHKDENTRELIEDLLRERTVLNRDIYNSDKETDMGITRTLNDKKNSRSKSNPLMSCVNNNGKNDKEANEGDNRDKTSLSDEFVNELVILNYIVDKMNVILENKKISVFKIIRVTKNFDARTDCSRRQYEYLMPAYLLCPMSLTDLELKCELERVCEDKYQEGLSEVNSIKRRKLSCEGSSSDLDNHSSKEHSEEDKKEKMRIFEYHQLNRQNNYGFDDNKKLVEYISTGDSCIFENNYDFSNSMLNYRVDSCTLGGFQHVLNEYIGTHSFHNFTSKSSYFDSNSWRHIDDIKAELFDIYRDSGVCSASETDKFKINMIKVVIKGQSFMLHQIRKMIALAIEVFRGTAPKNAIKLSFLPNKLSIHLSPSQGLLLDRVSYSTYNVKRSISTEKESFAIHFISFDDSECSFVKRMEHFKRNFIYKRICESVLEPCSPCERQCKSETNAETRDHKYIVTQCGNR